MVESLRSLLMKSFEITVYNDFSHFIFTIGNGTFQEYLLKMLISFHGSDIIEA